MISSLAHRDAGRCSDGRYARSGLRLMHQLSHLPSCDIVDAQQRILVAKHPQIAMKLQHLAAEPGVEQEAEVRRRQSTARANATKRAAQSWPGVLRKCEYEASRLPITIPSRLRIVTRNLGIALNAIASASGPAPSGTTDARQRATTSQPKSCAWRK